MAMMGLPLAGLARGGQITVAPCRTRSKSVYWVSDSAPAVQGRIVHHDQAIGVGHEQALGKQRLQFLVFLHPGAHGGAVGQHRRRRCCARRSR
jgi:hypothetical protein